jgi:serine/threonine protein kinase
VAGQLIETALISRERAQTYSVLRPIGQGGNSSAFQVLGTSGEFDGVPLAVKVFTGRPERRVAFLSEIQHLRAHPHPTVLDIYDVGETTTGAPFYVSRYMPSTLADMIKRGAADRYTKAILATQLLSAVAHLARSGQLVHRDIKPENLFVNGQAGVLGDFGMLMREDSEDIEVGTPKYYRTPELVRHKTDGVPPSPASDVFQCALVIVELFTGTNPLPADPLDRYAAVPQLTIPTNEDLDVPIASILNQMLELQAHNRPTAAHALNLFKGFVQVEVAKLQKPVA